MANDRWTYQVVEVRTSFLGAVRERVQDRLNQLGATMGREVEVAFA